MESASRRTRPPTSLQEQDNEDLHTYVQIRSCLIGLLRDVVKALEEEPPKILALNYRDPGRIQEFRSYTEPSCQGKLDLFLSHAALLEFVPAGVNKGNAVRFLCGYLGIPVEHSVAAGDAENDLTMIRAAGIGAAMCNGEDFLKEAADYITRGGQQSRWSSRDTGKVHIKLKGA